MLIGQVTKNGTGITIEGDFYDLDALYKIIHKIADSLTKDSFASDQLFDLAYEIRKANQGQRDQVDVTPYGKEPKIIYKATNLVLINFLLTLSTLRYYMGYIPTDEGDQATVYALESLTKNALIAKDSKYGLAAYEWTHDFPFTIEKLATPLAGMAIIDFLKTPPSKRFESIQEILTQYFMEGTKKKEAIQYLTSEAKRMQCEPDNLDFDWPEFEW